MFPLNTEHSKGDVNRESGREGKTVLASNNSNERKNMKEYELEQYRAECA